MGTQFKKQPRVNTQYITLYIAQKEIELGIEYRMRIIDEMPCEESEMPLIENSESPDHLVDNLAVICNPSFFNAATGLRKSAIKKSGIRWESKELLFLDKADQVHIFNFEYSEELWD